MSLTTTLALAILPAIRAKPPAVIEPPSPTLLDELDRARDRIAGLEADNKSLESALEVAWRRNDEMHAELARAQRRVDQLADMLNYARPAPIRPEPLDVLQRHYAGMQQASALQQQVYNATMNAQAANLAGYQQQGLAQQAPLGGAAIEPQDFCNCVPARHDAFRAGLEGARARSARPA